MPRPSDLRVGAQPARMGIPKAERHRMSKMTEPGEALKSFQQALLSGGLELESGRVDHDVYLHVDLANGQPRFTYVRLEGQTVTAFESFVRKRPLSGACKPSNRVCGSSTLPSSRPGEGHPTGRDRRVEERLQGSAALLCRSRG